MRPIRRNRTACSCVVEDVKGGESPPDSGASQDPCDPSTSGTRASRSSTPASTSRCCGWRSSCSTPPTAPRKPPTTPSPRSTSGGDRIDDHGAYLRTCVVNRCRDLQRRRRLERSRTPDPTSTYEDLGARELLDALAALPIKQRAAVVLRYYEGLSEAETAARPRRARRHREIDREPSAHPAARGGGAMTLTDPTFDAFEHRLRSELVGRAGTIAAPARDGRERIQRRVVRRRRARRTAGWRGRRRRAHRRHRRARPPGTPRRQRPLRRDRHRRAPAPRLRQPTPGR